MYNRYYVTKSCKYWKTGGFINEQWRANTEDERGYETKELFKIYVW